MQTGGGLGLGRWLSRTNYQAIAGGWQTLNIGTAEECGGTAGCAVTEYVGNVCCGFADLGSNPKHPRAHVYLYLGPEGAWAGVFLPADSCAVLPDGSGVYDCPTPAGFWDPLGWLAAVQAGQVPALPVRP